MKIKIFLATFLIALFSAISLRGNLWSIQDKTFVFADEDGEEEEIEDLEDKIQEYEDKLDELRGRSKTLSNEIEYMNSQINLTELRIQNSIANISKKEREIIKLAGDIENLKVRIEKLEDSIEYQKVVLASRLRERYKTRGTNPLLVIFGAVTLDTIVKKTEYLKVMELQDNKVLDEMEATKDAYERQKELFEEKKAEEEELKRQLEIEKANLDSYKASLENQKVEKKRLLEITQNDESKYQKLLEEAQKELEQIIRAVSVLKGQESEDVDDGDIIGVQGNTGYSFGDHLHFGVYKYSSLDDIDGWDWYYENHVNPSKKLKSKTVYWDTGCESSGYKDVGGGDWRWPLSSPTVSQGYGHTCWSDRYYGGKDHPAYDMFSYAGAPVYAVDDGEAYFCRNCLGDGANGVFIFHDDDYMTLYWHLQ
jgi:peptidoglycan hydrolase CwlO-like protein